MSEFRKISGHDHDEWLDEAAAAQLASEVLAAARKGPEPGDAPHLILHPDGPELLDVNRDQRGSFAEHWLIAGVWLTTILASTWRLLI